MATYPLTERAILLKAEDDVAIARKELAAGTVLEDGSDRIEARVDIKPGHKIARHAVRRGDPVRRYRPDHRFRHPRDRRRRPVHTHNLTSASSTRDRYQVGADVPPAGSARTMPRRSRATTAPTAGSARATTSPSSARSTARRASASYIAERFRDDRGSDFPNVDGVVAITHKGGCGHPYDGPDHQPARAHARRLRQATPTSPPTSSSASAARRARRST